MRCALTALCLLCALVSGKVALAQQQPVYDEDVKVRHFEGIEYPAIAESALVEGFVVVSVTLDGAGAVVTATALSGPRLLVPAVVDNAKKWAFMPTEQKRAVIVYEF